MFSQRLLTVPCLLSKYIINKSGMKHWVNRPHWLEIQTEQTQRSWEYTQLCNAKGTSHWYLTKGQWPPYRAGAGGREGCGDREKRERGRTHVCAGHTLSELSRHKGNSRQRGPGAGNAKVWFLVSGQWVGVGNLNPLLKLTASARLAIVSKPLV